MVGVKRFVVRAKSLSDTNEDGQAMALDLARKLVWAYLASFFLNGVVLQ